MNSQSILNILMDSISSIKVSVSDGFDKLLSEAIKMEHAKFERKLESKAVDELIHLFCEVLSALITVMCQTVGDVKTLLNKGNLGTFSKLVPKDEDLNQIEINTGRKKRKQCFFLPNEKLFAILKEVNPTLKSSIGYFILGVAEKVIYSILKLSVYYEENSQSTDPVIQATTIQTVLKLYEFQRESTPKSHIGQTKIPLDYDKSIDQLRSFLQNSYDQCNTILRIFFDPVRMFMPDNVKECHRLVNSFMNIFRALLESIEDMNDHISSGGNGRTEEQGFIGYCLEGPTDDYLFEDFPIYTEHITQRDFINDLLTVVEKEDVKKILLGRGTIILQTAQCKYPNIQWPLLHHRNCSHCSPNSAESKTNEAYVANENLSGNHNNNVSSIGDLLDTVSSPDTRNHSGECNFLLNSFYYLLPRLLMVPIFQFLYLQEISEHFYKLSSNEDDKITLKDVNSIYNEKRKSMLPVLRKLSDISVINSRIRTLHLREYHPQCHELQFDNKSVKLEDLDLPGTKTPDFSSFSNSEFIMSSELLVLHDNRKSTNCTVYLFENVILLYKEDTGFIKKNQLSHQNSSLKLKRIVPLENIHVIDSGIFTFSNPGSIFEVHLEPISNLLPNDEAFVSVDIKSKSNVYHTFQLQYQDLKQTNGNTVSINLATDSFEKKRDWMSSLLQLQTNRLFERYIKELPRQEIPLRLPDPRKYKFIEPDSPENIRFDKSGNDSPSELSDEEDYKNLFRDDSSSKDSRRIDNFGYPQIRYATLYKLIERLTYPTYHDLRALHMFLLAYRRFTTSNELLDLLIERFNVPNPEFSAEEQISEWKFEPSPADQMLKRFKNSYQRRVQRRVVWVIQKWVQNDSFFKSDFANDLQLRQKLLNFLMTIKSKELRNTCHALRQRCSEYSDQTFEDDCDFVSMEDQNLPPTMIWDIVKRSSEITIVNVHPIELARQITLYEWDLYHKIQYWEVESKESTSQSTPNLTKSKEFSNKIRNWFVYSIVIEEHPEDRATAIMRVADIMSFFSHWNNFQGYQEARAALISASVFRLKKSFNFIMKRYRHYKAIIQPLRKNADGAKGKRPVFYTEEYEKNIRRIEESNPPVPCVPFIAVGVTTKLIHTDLSSQNDIVTESGNRLINFRKHLLLSQIIERYLSFQRLQYRLRRDPLIMSFLDNLDPLGMVNAKNEDDFERIMYELSEKYESRDADSTSNVDLTSEKDRRLSKVEQKYADQLNSMPLKDKLDIHKQPSLAINNSVSTLTLISKLSLTATSSASTIYSEPSTPTNVEKNDFERSPPFIGQIRSPERNVSLSDTQPCGTPPLPPKTTKPNRESVPTGFSDVFFNASSNNLNVTISSNNSIPPPLPPRPVRSGGPPLPRRQFKD